MPRASGGTLGIVSKIRLFSPLSIILAADQEERCDATAAVEKDSDVLTFPKGASMRFLRAPSDRFTVALHPHTSRWKLVEGAPPPEWLSTLAPALEAPSLELQRRLFTVFLTNRCNLRCGYCRFSAATHTGTEYATLDLPAVAKAMLDRIQPGESVDIHFQGGEPLLLWEEIGHICEKLAASSHGATLKFHLTTNGTLMSPLILAMIRRHEIEITVSLDDIDGSHDRLRPYLNGKPSMQRVLDTMAILRESEVPYGVFSVVVEPTRMLETYDRFVGKLHLNSFLLAPLELDGTGDAGTVDRYMSSFVDAQLEVLTRNLDLFARTGRKVSENLTEAMLVSKVYPGHHSSACGDTPRSRCGDRTHSIERNGEVLACQNMRLAHGRGTSHGEYCLSRGGLCEGCSIEGHCSTPLCFSRLSAPFVDAYAAHEPCARDYVHAICSQLKRREMRLFEMFFDRKDDILSYLFADCS